MKKIILILSLTICVLGIKAQNLIHQIDTIIAVVEDGTIDSVTVYYDALQTPQKLSTTILNGKWNDFKSYLFTGYPTTKNFKTWKLGYADDYVFYSEYNSGDGYYYIKRNSSSDYLRSLYNGMLITIDENIQ